MPGIAEQLEKELNEMKAKKESLSKDITNMFNEKISLLSEISKYKETAQAEKNNTAKIISGNAEVSKQLAEKKLELRKTESRINQDTHFLDDREIKIKKLESDYAWKVKEVEGQTSINKEKAKSLSEKEQDIARRENAAADMLKTATAAIQESRALIEKYQDLNKEVNAKAEANAAIARQNAELAAHLRAELDEVNLLRIELGDQVKMYITAINQQEKNSMDLETKIKEREDEKASYVAKTMDLDKQADALKAKDNELKLQKLRMDKIIREKEIVTEIANLESKNAK